MDISGILIIGAGITLGISIGVGVALGFELVMRISGSGRSVILTWARVREKSD
jgi:hypothetical protein